jgi:fatty-acid desaturase
MHGSDFTPPASEKSPVGDIVWHLRSGHAPRDQRSVSKVMTAKLINSAAAVSPVRAGRLQIPTAVKPDRIMWRNTIAVVSYHVLALLAITPWFFSWTGVVLAGLGYYVFGVLGINICYHRLLTHRGFTCPKWFEHTLAVLGVCCLQDAPARWVAAHRRHHQYADEQPDPHSPLVNFFWAHMGWLLVENTDLTHLGIYYGQYAKDILRDPFYKHLERHVFWILAGSWVIFFVGGFAAIVLLGGTAIEAARFGASLVLWGVIVRTVLVWHVTWSINSVTHMWGYRSYATEDDSRNNILIAIVTNGEGWHNNHHADQRAAKHGHRWWEIDTSFLSIRLFEALGLADDIVLPNPGLADVRTTGRVSPRGYNEMSGR